MELLEILKEKGWYLTEEGIKKIPENVNKSNAEDVIKWALDMDFREIAGGAIPTEISKKDETLRGRIVLQISKIRNISSPKNSEDSYRGAPRLLQIELTDGKSQILCLETSPVPELSLNTPPGTKIYFKSETMQYMQGWILLSKDEVKLLGGKVPALLEKWEIHKALQKCAKSGRINTGSSGPPPWIPFGQEIQRNITDDKNFKSLNASKEKDNKANNEFDVMRNEAIAEAAKTGSKKVFGGGQQQMVDHNVKKIMEKGYSEDQAKFALKTTRNNLERALYNLKRRDENEDYSDKNRLGKRGPKDLKKTKTEEVVASKPAGNVSLFDYLTDKLPVTETTGEKTTVPAKPDKPPVKYNNNYNDTSKSNVSQQKYHQSQQQQQQQQQNAYQNNNIPQNNTQSSRPKFENNISSSFANRNSNNTSDQAYGGTGNRDFNSNRNRPNRDGNSHYNSSNQYSGNPRDSNDRYRGNPRNKDGRNARPSDRNSNYQNSSYNSSNNYESRHRNTNQQRGMYEKPGNPNSASARYHQKDGNNSNSQPQSSRPYHDNRQTNYNSHADKMNKLVDSTSKMRIENSKTPPSSRHNNASNINQQQQQQHQNHPSHHQQQHHPMQHHQQTQQLHHQHSQNLMQAPYNQLPNGFACDPSKIMGFRSKEANEFAMSVLKTQSVGTPAMPPPVLTPPQHFQPPPLQMAQPAFAPPPTQFLMAPQHPQHPQLPPLAVSQFGEYDWKIGDRCFAKYWDDGRFYEAEITDLTDKTCVVLFIEYGNHEEVHKTDCIPVTDSQNRTINYTKMNEVGIHHHHHQATRGATGRYRGERQVYVPPPKREV